MMDITRAGPLSGCLVSVVFTLSWVISAAIWGHWVLGTNSLSDIGVCGIPAAEIIFNYGCVLTGLLCLPLGVSLLDDRNRMFRLSGITSIICGFACFGIGVINEDYGNIHMIVAGIYGGSAAATIALTGAGDFTEGKKIFTLLAAILLIICGVSSLTCPFGVYEPIAVTCILVWTFIQSAIIYKRNTGEKVSGTDH